MAFPKISIITPSYNQGQFLEQTILSVLNQNYPNLEYIIIDGGSTDNSVEIIKRYEKHLTYWVSEKDRGQSHAINKGFKIATGDILGWINSDDYLANDALKYVADTLSDQYVWCVGLCQGVDSEGNYLQSYLPDQIHSKDDWVIRFSKGVTYSLPQPSTFYKKSVLEKTGLLDEKLHYVFDHYFFFKIYDHFSEPIYLNQILSFFRLHNASKTVSSEFKFKIEGNLIASELNTNHRLEKQIERNRSLLEFYSFIEQSPSLLSTICYGLKHPNLLITRFYLGYLKQKL